MIVYVSCVLCFSGMCYGSRAVVSLSRTYVCSLYYMCVVGAMGVHFSPEKRHSKADFLQGINLRWMEQRH